MSNWIDIPASRLSYELVLHVELKSTDTGILLKIDIVKMTRFTLNLKILTV